MSRSNCPKREYRVFLMKAERVVMPISGIIQNVVPCFQWLLCAFEISSGPGYQRYRLFEQNPSGTYFGDVPDRGGNLFEGNGC